MEACAQEETTKGIKRRRQYSILKEEEERLAQIVSCWLGSGKYKARVTTMEEEKKPLE